MFQYQTMRKSSVELSLVYKTFINKHTWETLLLPWKNKLNCLRNILALVDACTGALFREKCPYKFPPLFTSARAMIMKKTLRNLYKRRSGFLAQKYSKLFLETLSMLSMRIQLFNGLNNSECMKPHV